MHAMLAWAMGTALLGIDVGWQPIEEGGLEYIVQIDPETLARLKPGDELATGIRPVLRDVRKYRIVIGKGPLPRIALPETPAGSSGGAVPLRPAPAPLAATIPESSGAENSIVVPRERSAMQSRPAPLAATAAPMGPTLAAPAPGPRVAANPRLTPMPAPSAQSAPAPVARTMPSFNTLPYAAVKAPAMTPAPATLPERTWQAPAAAAPIQPAVSPTPKSIEPKVIDRSPAPLLAPPLVGEASKQPTQPSGDIGDRYRNIPLEPLPASPPATERYRDFSLPPANTPTKLVLPPPPEKKEAPTGDRSANVDGIRMKSNDMKIEKPKSPFAEFANPALPPPGADATAVKSKTAAKPPSFEFKEPAPLKESRLMADTLNQHPAPIVSDPAVRPASVEPTAAPTVGVSAAAAVTVPATPATGEIAHAEPPARPWLALILTLFALFASLGGNVFLGWVAHDARSRYGLLLREEQRHVAGGFLAAHTDSSAGGLLIASALK